MSKILVIEDNADIRNTVIDVLTFNDFEVVQAEDGIRGFEVAKNELPDLVLCDVLMPRQNGWETLEKFRSTSEFKHTPFVFTTALSRMDDMRKGMRLGADDYITKPFEEVELLDAIDMRFQKAAKMQKDVDRDADGLGAFIDEARTMAALEALSENRESRFYHAKDNIFQEGMHPHFLLFINKGKVKTYKTNEDAKEYITGLHKKGDFLGYASLLQDAPYAESAMALEDTEILLIPKKDFLALMYNNRDVSLRFIKLLSSDLEDKEEQLLHLAYDTVRKRVADALLLLQERYQDPAHEHFSMAISRDNLASIVGTSKECVIRVLSEFKGEKIVETHQSEITILDDQKLKEVRW